jgi:ribose 5-phosphate isomerase B
MADVDIEKIVQSVVDTIRARQAAGAPDLSPDTTARVSSLNQRDDVRHVAIGADCKGQTAKAAILPYLESLGYRVVDVSGAGDGDFADVAVAVARKVASGDCERGIVIDGDGIGASIVCNKVSGIRAALCYDMRSIVNSREHWNANVLALGGPFHNGGELCEMTRVWLESRFPSGERWSIVNKMKAVDRSH